jgi:dolichol-phosphate mannosyltransferase
MNKIIIVIPTYNEVENIGTILPSILSEKIQSLGILCVDDNSQDGTSDIINKLIAEYPDQLDAIHRPAKMGLGSAYIDGFTWAINHGAEVIGQMDADFSHPPHKLIEMLEALSSYDLIIGSRYVAGGKLDQSWPLSRRILSSFGNWYARSILNSDIKDFTGGYKLWRRNVLEHVLSYNIKSNGYIFQVETNHIAKRLGYLHKEIPIHFIDRRGGKSKMSISIQIEAALKIWQVLFSYRNLNKNRSRM